MLRLWAVVSVSSFVIKAPSRFPWRFLSVLEVSVSALKNKDSCNEVPNPAGTSLHGLMTTQDSSGSASTSRCRLRDWLRCSMLPGQLGQFAAEFVKLVGLSQHGKIGPRVFRAVAIPRRQKDRQLGVFFPNGARQFQTIHFPGHDDIAEHQINAVGLDFPESGLRIAGPAHGVAELFKKAGARIGYRR